MHWGGHIPLPDVQASGPVEVPTLGLEPDKETMLSTHGTGTRELEMSLYERLRAKRTFNPPVSVIINLVESIDGSKGPSLVLRLEQPLEQPSHGVESRSETRGKPAHVDGVMRMKRGREREQLGPFFWGRGIRAKGRTFQAQEVTTIVGENTDTQKSDQSPGEVVVKGLSVPPHSNALNQCTTL